MTVLHLLIEWALSHDGVIIIQDFVKKGCYSDYYATQAVYMALSRHKDLFDKEESGIYRLKEGATCQMCGRLLTQPQSLSVY